jgi:hypothetical protein
MGISLDATPRSETQRTSDDPVQRVYTQWDSVQRKVHTKHNGDGDDDSQHSKSSSSL